MNRSEFYISLVLAGGERHGYSIMQEVHEQTAGKVRLGPGTLYTAIKRLLSAGYIEEVADRPDPALDDSRRRYYRLTEPGRKAIAAEAVRLAKDVQVAHQRGLLDEKLLPGTAKG